jgi:hypothetical protein
MSQEHDIPSPDEASVADGIHPEAAPFEPGYQPETLPKISVPDLADDAQGLSAEALAQVPTLTELVDDAPGQELLPAEPAAKVEAAPTAPATSATEPAPEPLEPVIQDPPAQADTWVQELHVRMGKLNGDIHTLNARLDRLEERNKKKA